MGRRDHDTWDDILLALVLLALLIGRTAGIG